MYRRSRRRLLVAQAAVEAGLVMPLLALLALGTYDLSRAFSLSAQAESAARSGLRAAISDPGASIATAIYYEPNNLNSSSNLNWGAADPSTGGADTVCNDLTGSYQCGDPYGCYAPGVNGEPTTFWASGVNACFAMRVVECPGGIQSCTTANLRYEGWATGACYTTFSCSRPQFQTGSPGPDNQDPSSSNYVGLEVVVTFRFHPDTGIVSRFFNSTGGDLYIRHYVIGYPVYGPLNCCAMPAGVPWNGSAP